MRRVLIPRSALVGDNVDPVVLARGIEYGSPWEELLEIRVTPELIAAELRRRGIWTVDDLHRKPGEALAALQAAYGVDYQSLVQAAEAHEREA